MFVRVRGKGASPENSQAATMHLRGFRFSNSGAPVGASLVLPLTPLPHVHADDDNELTATAAPHTQPTPSSPHVSSVALAPLLRRRFAFAHFPVGVQATSVVAQQRAYDAQLTAQCDNNARTSSSAAPGSATDAHADATTRPLPLQLADTTPAQREASALVWKELWNVYDIVYDDVPLLPWPHAQTNALLRELAALSGASRCSSSSSAATTHRDAATTCLSLRLSAQHTSLRALTGNRKVVVCTHYLAEQARAMQYTPSAATSDRDDGARTCGGSVVLVFDCSTLSADDAGSKLAVQLAWLAAYTSLLPSQPLVRAAAVLVCLPYDDVPCMSWLQAQAQEQAQTQTTHDDASVQREVHAAAAAVCDAFDFLAQHVTLLHDSFVRDVTAATHRDEQSRGWRALPVGFVGRAAASADAADVEAAVRACVQHVQQQQHNSRSATTSSCCDVVYVVGDNTSASSSSSSSDGKSNGSGQHGDTTSATASAVATRVQRAATTVQARVHTLVVPVQALLSDDEEVWDAYTQREHARLNFCPCCSQCNHDHHA